MKNMLLAYKSRLATRVSCSLEGLPAGREEQQSCVFVCMYTVRAVWLSTSLDRLLRLVEENFQAGLHLHSLLQLLLPSLCSSSTSLSLSHSPSLYCSMLFSPSTLQTTGRAVPSALHHSAFSASPVPRHGIASSRSPIASSRRFSLLSSSSPPSSVRPLPSSHAHGRDFLSLLRRGAYQEASHALTRRISLASTFHDYSTCIDSELLSSSKHRFPRSASSFSSGFPSLACCEESTHSESRDWGDAPAACDAVGLDLPLLGTSALGWWRGEEEEDEEVQSEKLRNSKAQKTKVEEFLRVEEKRKTLSEAVHREALTWDLFALAVDSGSFTEAEKILR